MFKEIKNHLTLLFKFNSFFMGSALDDTLGIKIKWTLSKNPIILLKSENLEINYLSCKMKKRERNCQK